VALAPTARPTLALQAAWLRRHPEVVVRVEGYGDGQDTRDHALAAGAARAEEVRSYLVLLGVPAAQVSTTSWGKERPGLGRAVTVLVRVVTPRGAGSWWWRARRGPGAGLRRFRERSFRA